MRPLFKHSISILLIFIQTEIAVWVARYKEGATWEGKSWLRVRLELVQAIARLVEDLNFLDEGEVEDLISASQSITMVAEKWSFDWYHDMCLLGQKAKLLYIGCLLHNNVLTPPVSLVSLILRRFLFSIIQGSVPEKVHGDHQYKNHYLHGIESN